MLSSPICPCENSIKFGIDVLDKALGLVKQSMTLLLLSLVFIIAQSIAVLCVSCARSVLSIASTSKRGSGMDTCLLSAHVYVCSVMSLSMRRVSERTIPIWVNGLLSMFTATFVVVHVC